MERNYTDAVPFPESVEFEPIARIVSPFTERHGTPRQPGFNPKPNEVPGQGSVVLLDHIPTEALRDLEGFDRVWLITYLHLNGPGSRPLVRPPRGGPKRGLFSTRAPHRPNALGLSAVRLLAVQGRTLVVAELDLLNDTPVLDIKPYIADFDAFPTAGRGWL
ncbi:MAG: tRNA (N6-threonylcarbamoyladenosine(37)-N6)-methyltransferase TrmO [Myxococcota bacterium]